MRATSVFFLAIAAFSLACFGCSGGGGSSSSGPSLNGNVISGVASKGIIANGNIKIYSLKSDGSKGDLLASALTDSNGEYAATVGSYSGPVLVEASGNYQDEATGQQMTISANAPLRAAYPNITGATTISVSPFTEIAVRKASSTSLTPTSINTANNLIASIFTFDSIKTKPLAMTVAALQTSAQSQKDYTLALAALSQMAKTSGTPVSNVIDAISGDIISKNALSTTLAGFIAALHLYQDNNPPIKQVVKDTGGTQLELIGSLFLPVNSIATGSDGALYAGINAFTRFSSAKINTFKSYSSASLYRLSPGASHWQLYSKVPTTNSGYRLIIDPTSSYSATRLYFCSEYAVFTSGDSGQSWTSLGGAGLLEDIAIDFSGQPTTNPNIYIATLGWLYMSSYLNNSFSWNLIGNGLPAKATLSSITIDPNHPNVLYAGGHNGGVGTGVYKSSDGGLNWSFISGNADNGLDFTEKQPDGTFATFHRDISSILVDPRNSNTIYAGAYNSGLWKSTDGGNTWFQLKNELSGWISRLVIDASGRLYVMSLNGLYYSNDGGKTWLSTLTTAGLTRNVGDLAIDKTNPNIIYVAYGGGILKGTFNSNNSISWSNITQ
ncbi:WD40/YVTN/BNR-like repeat-containing protein [Geomesophilobacter sediminis]|uniref:Photosynthesis system II assembly factor Ycf48/Hcf136-like domain-containing protein n=1 Tax=Geomesophilobacter sediminis TaxID=2798584 RepID=A0A8J7LUF5_9BACT|nr:hypothetical protein [Geomesophilobacter sediminis]MBJ6724589.1 hypothetical protein [Geomesophilobacter sediminis]